MRPNFVVFIVDQLCADHLGCYGNQIVKTPNIDRLAARGWKAENCYVTTPICMPNRASLMTGRMPSAHGVRHNGIPLGLNTTTFVELLRLAGYSTALIGKSHLQTMTDLAPLPVPNKPRRSRDGTQRFPGDYLQESASTWQASPSVEMTLPFYGFEQAEVAIEHGDDINGHYRKWLAKQDLDAESLMGRENAHPSDYALASIGQAWRTRLPEELHPSSWIATRTCERIQEYAREAQSFFLYCSFPDPHHPYTPPGKYWDMYRPEDVELPASYQSSATPPPHLAWLREQREKGTPNNKSMACFAATEREAREAIALNYGSISFIDDRIGRVLDTLEQEGLADNTVILFTTDHGEYAGDHQLLFKGSLHYRSLVRTPLIWADPQSGRGRETAPLSTIDISASILDRANVEPCNGMQGISFLNSVRKLPYSGRDSVLIEEEGQRTYYGFDSPVRMRSLIRENHRISVYNGVAWGELYDHSIDPHEQHNLWDKPESQAIKYELMEALLQQMMTSVDTSLSPLAVA